MSEQTLISLAVLTVNWNRGHDAIESFVPIVAECIRKDGDQPVSLVQLQKAVAREAGIKIPSGALQAILGRCSKRGLVKRENNVYVPQRKKLDELNYGPAQAEALRQHRCLLDKLRAFAKERLSGQCRARSIASSTGATTSRQASESMIQRVICASVKPLSSGRHLA